MKVVLLFALVAAAVALPRPAAEAEAEADPFFYSAYHYGYPYHTLPAQVLTYKTPAATVPITYTAGFPYSFPYHYPFVPLAVKAEPAAAEA